ncbi:WG repeat-containing protein [Hymenobacter daeguensis]
MKKLANLLHLLLLAAPALAQKPGAAPPPDAWTQFAIEKKEDYAYGYKDADGHIRIPAMFGSFTNAQRFRHIMAVSERATLQQYYLLKNGRQVGRDSVYMFDYTFDCESEGKIRFRDRKRNRVGFFDSAGHVCIPAVYNSVMPFHNGLTAARMGAHLKCLSGEKDTTQCEHAIWVGGRNVLINPSNEVLADNLPEDQLTNLNWYSLRINAPAIDTATTRTFRAVNDDQYTFTDYEKEFTRWFYTVFVPAIRTGAAGKAAPFCYSELVASGKPFRDWQHFERAAFVRQFYQSALLSKLSTLRFGAKNVSIFSEDLNTLIFSGPRFQSFLTDCNEHFREKYPVFNVVISPVDASGQSRAGRQEHFAFIRTAEGYRLFSVSL